MKSVIQKLNKIQENIPNEILWMIIEYAAMNCKRTGKYADLLELSKVDRSFNCISNAFLWSEVNLTSPSQLRSILAVLRDPGKSQYFGYLIKSITLASISFIENKDWMDLLNSCAKLTSICVERCHIQEGVGDTDFDPLTNPPLESLRMIVVSDSPNCPVQPILSLCSRARVVSKLSITGCNYNESDMCQMIAYCPYLNDIKLGSHAGASLTTIGSAGGDEFARTLAENCPLLTGNY